MCRIFILFFLILFILNCSSGPQIIRVLEPAEDIDYSFNETIISNKIIKEQDKVKITVEYMDRKRLYEIAKENNPYVDRSGFPILTTFKITVQNLRSSKIKFEPENAILLDGMGNQFNALTYEDFKQMYPSSVYQQYEYSFIFNRYYIDTYYTEDYKKRQKVGKSLFKGGNIYSGVKVEGILPFQQINEYAKDITLILPDIILYEEVSDKDISDIKEIKRLEFRFKFRQKIIRAE